MRRSRAFVAILVALVAVLLVILALPRPAAQTSAPSWRTVAVFQGGSNGTTPAFVVADRWRVRWSASPGSAGPSSFGVVVLALGSETPFDIFGNVVGAGHGMALEQGTGQFALQVRTTEPYHLVVQTLASRLPSQPRLTWRTLATYRGAQDLLTPAVRLSSPWRITWTAQGQSGNFAISVLRELDQIPVDVIANLPTPAHGQSYEYDSGAFHLDIAADGRYLVTVQQGSRR